MNINELISYFAQGGFSYFDMFIDEVESGSAIKNESTHEHAFGFIIPLQGKAEFVLNGAAYSLEPGKVAHASPNLRLDKKVIGDESWKYAVVHYTTVQSQTLSDFIITVKDELKLFELINQLYEYESIPSSQAALKRQTLFYILLEQILLSAKKVEEQEDKESIEEIIAYIHRNYMNHLSITEIAHHFKLDRRHLAYIFKGYTGMSPINYLTEFRIKKSKELLRYSIMQVSKAVGIDDNLYFSRVFKKHTGVTPSIYKSSYGRI
jgi:YesN/AraC family two-component response regulator